MPSLAWPDCVACRVVPSNFFPASCLAWPGHTVCHVGLSIFLSCCTRYGPFVIVSCLA